MSPLHAIASLFLAIALLVHDNDVGFSNAFHINSARPASIVSRTQIFSSEQVGNDETTSEDKTSSMMTLNPASETVVTSDLAAVDNNKSLYDFFALQSSALLILRAKNNQINEVENVDTDLFKQYQHNCENFNASAPTPDDRIYDVTTAGLQFPGLKVMSVVTIGVKMISTNSDLPGYELVLIRDETYAKGSRLFVWFFNKVTGKNKNNKDEPSPGKDQTTFSISRINVVPKENGMLSFEANANLSLLIQFPSFLMKAIPGASKEKFEKTGGEALLKALDTDLPMALEGFRQEYVLWLEE
mmetsp:Transcript_32416/g.68171  ORF Transcript_32416/g.68171 Transcript_32416/m.68171 type:complete len:300 (-) Transcript_32416:950-1849(-)